MNKTTIYGLPLNPMPLLNELRGASFCVSYGTRDKLGKQLDQAIELVGQDSILLVDNGAFSAFQAGVDTMSDESYLTGFATWANDILARCPQAIAVLPDVIGGTPEQNAQLINETVTMFPDLRVMPMWHIDEPIEQLLWMCEGAGMMWDYVGIGSTPKYGTIGSPAWTARIEEAMAAVDAWEAESDGAYVRPRFHMMRAQSQAHKFAFDSSDSTNVAVNHNRQLAKGEDIKAFAGRIDARIQASATAQPAAHQIARPLDGHVAQAEWTVQMRAAQVARRLVVGAAQVSLEQAGLQAIWRANARRRPQVVTLPMAA